MARIFFSHSSVDELEAVALKQWLIKNGWSDDDIFLDVDPKRGLLPGDRWQNELHKALDYCEAIVILISPAWANSMWCRVEFGVSKHLNKPIFGVVVKEVSINDLPSELTSEWQLCHLAGDGSKVETIEFFHRQQQNKVTFLVDGLIRLKQGLEKVGLNANFFHWPPDHDLKRSPYRGLQALDVDDAGIFFGRDVEIMRGLDALRGMRDSHNKKLFVILGASGAGKSSFLRAGLIPRLRKDERNFLVLPVIRPQREPISGEYGLASSLFKIRQELKLTPRNRGVILTELRSSLSLEETNNKEPNKDLYKQLELLREDVCTCFNLSGNDDRFPTVVIPVDQAEELFNTDAGPEAKDFLVLLGRALREKPDKPAMSIIVAFTIRTDRYDSLQIAPELAGLDSEPFDDLKPMPINRFQEIILGPAKRISAQGGKLDISPDLVNQLLEDSSYGGDSLPLLSLTLYSLYKDYGTDGDLRLDEYHAMGGITHIVKKEAESILSNNEEMRKQQLDWLKATFIPWLATINPDNDSAMRRVAKLVDLPSESLPLIEALIEKRLLLKDKRNNEEVVEIAHEALLRQWDVLADWLNDHRDDLKEANHLLRAEELWRKNKKKTEWLITGERLENAEALIEKEGFAKWLSECSEFLQQSRHEENAKQQAKIDAENHIKQALRDTIALRLIAEGDMMIAGLRPGGTVLGLLKILAGHRISPSLNSLSAIQAQNIKYASLISVSDNCKVARTMAVSPDGQILITTHCGLMSLWDTETGNCITKHNFEHVGGISCITFCQDSYRIVLGHSDLTLRLWDIKTGKAIGKPFVGHTEVKNIPSGIEAVTFNEDSNSLISVTHPGELICWNVDTQEIIGSVFKLPEAIFNCVFSSNGQRMLTYGLGKDFYFWEQIDSVPVKRLIEHDESLIRDIHFTADGENVIWVDSHNCVHLIDFITAEPIYTPFKIDRHEVSKIALSPDDKLIVTGGEDGTLGIWDIETGKPHDPDFLIGHQKEINKVVFAADGQRIVSASEDKTLMFWNLETDCAVLRANDQIRSIAFDPNSSHFVAGGWNGSLQLWDFKTRKPVEIAFENEVLLANEIKLSTVAFSPDGRQIAAGLNDGTARFWDVTTGKLLNLRVFGHNSWINDIAFSLDGRIVVSASNDKKIIFWDTQTGMPLKRREFNESIHCVAFSPDGKYIVVGSRDNYLYLLDADSGVPTEKILKGHQDDINTVAFSPDGKLIVSGSDDKTLMLWDTETGQAIGEPLRAHEKAVNSVAFSPDGKYIVSSSDDDGHTLRFWDVLTRQPIGQPLKGHSKLVNTVKFSPDGNYVLSGSWDFTIRVWSTPKIWADELCKKLNRNMSYKEWCEWVSPDIDYLEQCPGLPIPSDDSTTETISNLN